MEIKSVHLNDIAVKGQEAVFIKVLCVCKTCYDFISIFCIVAGHPWWPSGKESPCNARDAGLHPESGRSPGEGNGNPLQHSCLENPVDKGAWQATVHGIANELDMTETKQQFCIKH